MDKSNYPERRKQGREVFATEGEIYLESSVFRARLIDFSDNGVRFEMKKPIRVHVRFRVGHKRVDRIAQFVWSLNKEDGDNVYGFKFIGDR